MKPKYLYHGSGKKIEENLIPKKAKDLGEEPDNMLRGIYASDLKKEAVIMGILACKGVKHAGSYIKGKKIDAIIYQGWPKQKYFYLYKLPSKTFKERPKKSHQWVSLKFIKPLKIEKLPVKKYINLVRKATKKEKKDWNKKFKDKLK